MTDYSELVEELREQARLEDEYPEDAVIKRRAADALEAQAKRIAELDGVIESGIEHLKATDDLIAECHARIAELEVLVRSAYEEGWFDAAPCHQHPQQTATQFEKDWLTSLARAALHGASVIAAVKGKDGAAD